MHGYVHIADLVSAIGATGRIIACFTQQYKSFKTAETACHLIDSMIQTVQITASRVHSSCAT
eukprot:6327-Heterococcus_DN1.PRE.2